jgi:preprotein translocase subunit SecB
MQEVAQAPIGEGETAPERCEIGLSINLRVGASKNGVGRVMMTTTVTPDPRVKPYQIEVRVVGEFEAVNSSPAEFQLFCRQVAPGILFPYIRQIVDTATLDARYGVVRLDPINLNAFLEREEWKADRPFAKLP